MVHPKSLKLRCWILNPMWEPQQVQLGPSTSDVEFPACRSSIHIRCRSRSSLQVGFFPPLEYAESMAPTWKMPCCHSFPFPEGFLLQNGLLRWWRHKAVTSIRKNIFLWWPSDDKEVNGQRLWFKDGFEWIPRNISGGNVAWNDSFGQAKISNCESAGTLFCLKAKARPLAAMQL